MVLSILAEKALPDRQNNGQEYQDPSKKAGLKLCSSKLEFDEFPFNFKRCSLSIFFIFCFCE